MQKSQRQNGAGFTLIELLIVIAIIAVVATLGAASISNSMRSKTRQLTWRVTTMVKYLYNSSITENKTNRLVLDFESNSYWAESTFDKFLLDKASALNDKRSDVKKEEVKKAVEETEGETGGEEAKAGEDEENSYIEPQEASFGAVESIVIETKQIPKGISIKDVWTEHDLEPVTQGRAYIYFFPSGVAERAIINFKDDSNEDKQFSVSVEPFTGDVDIEPEYRRLEEVKK